MFSGHGQKFDPAAEAQIEALVADPSFTVDTETPAQVLQENLVDAYLGHAREVLPASSLDASAMRGARIALDCANGATTTVAPRLFRELGFDVTVIGNEPDGRNINLNCGSTHPECLADLVRNDGFRLGIAFDGDGDRAILVDHDGKLVDGDAVLLMSAKHMRTRGRLKGNAVVATVMSNIGLEIALRDLGIEMLRTPVGDRYVMEEILEARPLARRRAVGPHHLLRLSCSPATASSPRCPC